MPIKLERQLSPLKVKNAKPGMYADGGCLYLQVTASKDGKRLNRSWIFRFRVAGRLRDMGLGSIDTLSLSEARERAREQRKQRLDGIDPIDARRALVAPAVNLMTFDQAAAEVIKSKEDTWSSAVHAAQWRETVKVYCSPFVGSKPVRDVNMADVTRILDAIWKEKPETANRVRGRIEAVLNWAKARGHRDGENPARWGQAGAHWSQRTLCGPPLRESRRVHDRAPRHKGRRRARTGIYDLDRSANERSDGRPVVGDRRDREDLDGSCEPNEGRQGTSRPLKRSGPRPCQGREPQRAICFWRR